MGFYDSVFEAQDFFVFYSYSNSLHEQSEIITELYKLKRHILYRVASQLFDTVKK